ncbi:MAG: hypothetical protein GY797_09590 [Deltaproteobacteria bacterium]|nr:hypothetical protein [Deltaproteobacteria bacterium]
MVTLINEREPLAPHEPYASHKPHAPQVIIQKFINRGGDFFDEEGLTAEMKSRLLEDWQRFVFGGFKHLFFTPDLHRFLMHQCGFSGRFNQESFWGFHFDSKIGRLLAFLNQFGGDYYSVEYRDLAWLAEGCTALDLKAAMCLEMARVYTPFSQVLQDLEFKHLEIIQVWEEFAGLAQIEGIPAPPTRYHISENVRNLLRFAAEIALKKEQRLFGVQQAFPFYYFSEGRLEQPAEV